MVKFTHVRQRRLRRPRWRSHILFFGFCLSMVLDRAFWRNRARENGFPWYYVCWRMVRHWEQSDAIYYNGDATRLVNAEKKYSPGWSFATAHMWARGCFAAKRWVDPLELMLSVATKNSAPDVEKIAKQL